jgi:hypothetical protein
MNKKLLNFLIFVGLFIYNGVFASEITYPTIGRVSMPANPTFGNYFVYFFTAGLLVGIIAAIIVLISVSVRYFLLRGDLAQAQRARSEIIRAIFGLVILFGSIVIINTINPGINNNAIDNIDTAKYSGGLMLQFEDGTESHLGGDLREVGGKSITGIRWLSNATDLPRIYVYPSKDFVGTATEVPNGTSAVINIGQSISFDWNIPGVYLYNDYNFGLKGRKSALAIVESQPALSNVDFDKKTASIKFVPETTASKEITYGAVLFTGSNYTGKCSWVLSDLKDIRVVNKEENSVRVGTTDTFIGIGDPTIDTNKDFVGVSSVYLLKSPSTENISGVSLFNGTNCVSRAATWDGTAFKNNTCNPTDFKKELKFSEACKDMPQDGDTILSAIINNGTVLLLKDAKGDCQLFTKRGADSCVRTIPYGSIYDAGGTRMPRYFTLLPGK